MTASDLSGRDLDVAVARALGWTFVTFPDGPCPDVRHWKRPTVDAYHWRPDPQFATDPATLDEKLAWLLHYGCFDIMVTPEGVSIDFSGFDTNHDCRVQGKDIHEATARLVVAVKEAMGDG